MAQHVLPSSEGAAGGVRARPARILSDIGWLSLQANRYLGLEVEARHREALHSAIMTGVRRSLAGNLSREQIIQEALHYVRTSVPEAVRALVTDDGIFRALAEAKLREVLDTQGRAPGALG